MERWLGVEQVKETARDLRGELDNVRTEQERTQEHQGSLAYVFTLPV